MSKSEVDYIRALEEISAQAEAATTIEQTRDAVRALASWLLERHKSQTEAALASVGLGTT